MFYHAVDEDGLSLFHHDNNCCDDATLDTFEVIYGGGPAGKMWEPLLNVEDLYSHGDVCYADLTLEEFSIKMGIGELVEIKEHT